MTESITEHQSLTSDCKIQPLFAKIILTREKLKSSNIIIPAEAEKRNAKAVGIVVAVGPNADDAIQVGQKVMFGQYAGDWIEIDGDEYFICLDEDIHGILK